MARMADYRVEQARLFEDYDVSGVHLDNPEDGDPIEVWDDFVDSDQAFMFVADPSERPVYRATSLIRATLEDLDFDGVATYLRLFGQTGLGVIDWVTLMGTSAEWSVFLVFEAEAITSTAANPWNGHCLFGINTANYGLFLRDVSGEKRISHYGFDGTNDILYETPVEENAGYVVGVQFTVGGLFNMAVINAAGSRTDVGGTENAPVVTGSTSLNLGWNGGTGGAASVFLNGRLGEIYFDNSGTANGGFDNTLDDLWTKWFGSEAVLTAPFRTTIGAVRR